MLKALSQGIGQLNDKATRKYLWFSVGAAVITFFILWSFVAWLLSETAISSIGWLESIIDILGGLATAVLTWVLFPATVSAVIGFFLDQVAECVENRHYPALPKADGQPMVESLVTTAKFFGMLIGLNVLLLPFLFIVVRADKSMIANTLPYTSHSLEKNQMNTCNKTRTRCANINYCELELQ